ncbi:putative protein Mb0912 [Mycobacterium bovis AF2122/97] [Rhizoctonia solani]|uniref:Jacalin-type lectin domain-containing protein n=1 Tax=Rhizoctonia solani TaxID=456999 RepID=A0A0K6G3Q0_9AGAM|nr:putative protein Mb0912 [Mycobacterium bovis AF2122/97] [Rhizoctonia solani]
MHYSTLFLVAGSFGLAIPTDVTKQDPGSSGKFNVLSMSVNGLRATLDGSASEAEKIKKTMYMGMCMSHYNYGIINIQKSQDHHRFRTEPFGGFLIDSGLNTLSNYRWIDFSRIQWQQCGNDSGYDCLVNKGFTFMRVRIHEGVYIDMINLHADAGVETGDLEARSANIGQLADYINTHSTGNAVIVFGTTNSRYTRSQDNIRLLIDQNDLTDAWVEAVGGEPPAAGTDAIVCPKGVPPDITCEVVDKILYRSSPIINLKSSGFFYDTSRFLLPDGNTLTDHHPVRADFEYTLTSGLRQSDLYGGPHGTWFNDLPLIPPSPKLAHIALCGDKRLDAINITLTSGQIFGHGGSGGDCYLLPLAPQQYITSIKLCWDKKDGHTRIFYARVTVNEGRTVRAGTITKDCATTRAPNGYGVVGTYGRAGDEIDRLGFIYAQQCAAGEFCFE